MSEQDGLTARQREVLELVAKGHTNSEIANLLSISLDGAKWHVSEILARLGVETREEAGEWWRRERSVPQRTKRLIRGFGPGSALGGVVIGGGIVAAVVAGVLVALALALRSGTPDPLAAAPALATPEQTPNPADPPNALASPASAVPDGPVAFRVCGESSGVRKLTPAEMQDVFTNRRFGDGVRPGPFYWAMYLSDYYWIQDPHAVSANVENVALSRGTFSATPGSNTLRSNCPTPDERQDERYQALWLYDHRAVAMRSDAGVLTVVVEAAPGHFENVEFPDPALPRAVPPTKDATAARVGGLRVANINGQIVASRGLGAADWEFHDDGTFASGFVGSGAPRPQALNLRVATDLEFFCTRAASAITATSAAGESHTVPPGACLGPWDVAASLHLEPGDWTISVDGDAFYTVLPRGGPRP